MARRRREDGEDWVDLLRAPEHEWWVKRPTDPFAPVEPEAEEAETDDAAGVDPETDEAAGPEEVEPDPYDERADPYAVLRLPPTATWDEITASYRRLARWWHPDGLGAASEWGRAACESKIRQLNRAYAELRVRRDR